MLPFSRHWIHARLPKEAPGKLLFFYVRVELGSWDYSRPCSESGRCLRSTRIGFPRCWLCLVRQWIQVIAPVYGAFDSISHIFYVKLDSGICLDITSTIPSHPAVTSVAVSPEEYWKLDWSGTCSLVSGSHLLGVCLARRIQEIGSSWRWLQVVSLVQQWTQKRGIFRTPSIRASSPSGKPSMASSCWSSRVREVAGTPGV